MKAKKVMLMSMALALTVSGVSVSAAEKQTVKVGLATSLSGAAPRMGEIIQETAEMTVKMANEEGWAENYELELVVMDDKLTSEGAVDAVNNLIYQENCDIIIGHLMSVQNLATDPICEEEQIPIICYGGGAVPTMQGMQYTMRSTVDDFATIHAMCDYLIGEKGYQKIAIFYVNSDAGTVGLEEGTKYMQENYGIDWVSQQAFNNGDPDFQGQVLAAREVEPDVCLIWGGGQDDAAIILSQIKQLMGEDMPVHGGMAVGQTSMISAAGAAKLDGICFPTGWIFDETREMDVKFSEAFQAIDSQGETPTELGARIYDAVLCITNGLNTLGEYDVDADDFSVKLNESILASEFEGLQGQFKFDDMHNCLNTSYVAEYQYNEEDDSLAIVRVY
ncbi:MAG: ABC transporter substrate-binding protein [Eubacteriales bacterium]|nr:ABC transporter substrate-binding protein [Eubacteriales bacterium]